MISNPAAFESVIDRARDAVLGVISDQIAMIEDNEQSIAVCMGTLIAAARVALAAKDTAVPAEIMADAFVSMAKEAGALVVTEAREAGLGGSGSRA